MQSFPLKPLAFGTQWCGAKYHFGAGRPPGDRSPWSPLFGFETEVEKISASGPDRILPSSVSSKMTGCNRIGAVFIDVLYIQLHLESNYCMIWEYHHLLQQSFGLCGLEIVCEFAGHSCASFRKQGVHV